MSKVSIIMPAYNTEDYIEKAIESVLNQTYQNWELIIVDDNSNDNTYEIAKKYENNKIKIIKNDMNYGCYVSLNEGLMIATGDYITRIDSDDTFHQDKLKLQVNILDNMPNMVASSHKFMRGTQIRNNNEISYMYRKEIIDKIGYYDSVRYGADTEFIHRIQRVYPRRVHHIPQVLYYAGIREESLTHNKRYAGVGVRYVRQYKSWHNKNAIPKMPYPIINRPFSVDKINL